MAKTKNKLPRWAEIPLALIFAGIIIWAIVPGEVLYISLGIALAVIGGVSYLIYRKWGTRPFKTLAKGTYKWLTENRKPQIPPSLPPHEANNLKVAVGQRCENPNCPTSHPRSVEVHHIIPRTEKDSSHKLRNLLVLCRECHKLADDDTPNRDIQKLWTNKRPRFRKEFFHLVKDWKHGW